MKSAGKSGLLITYLSSRPIVIALALMATKTTCHLVFWRLFWHFLIFRISSFVKPRYISCSSSRSLNCPFIISGLRELFINVMSHRTNEEPHRACQSIPSSTATSAIDIDSNINNSHLRVLKSKSNSMPCQASVEGAIRDVGRITTSADANGENVKKKNPWYYPLVLLDFLIGNWFLIGIGVVIVLAWKFPHVAANGGSKYIDTRVRVFKPLIRLQFSHSVSILHYLRRHHRYIPDHRSYALYSRSLSPTSQLATPLVYTDIFFPFLLSHRIRYR